MSDVKHRTGFTFIEVLLVIGVASLIAGVSVPTYRNYKVRSDLYLARDVVIQGLYRARLLSQSGEHDDEWHYEINEGIVFKGDDFATRDTDYDELFVLPDSVFPTGIEEVAFERITGVPSPDGDIVLESLLGEKIYIPISPDTAISGDAPPPARLKVTFSLIDDHDSGDSDDDDDHGHDDDDDHGHGGHGHHDHHDDDDDSDVINYVYVGSGSIEYTEGTWIPLTERGVAIIDDPLTFTYPGLHIRRMNGYVEVVHSDTSAPGHKSMIDATITFENALISDVQNGPEPYETEKPFDGNENSGVGGDEVTTASDNTSVLFQTREANGRDTILLYWE
ncbi:type II secretion system protein [Candidatus Peribacteria bacterium]|nr:type II secretion system protein [Candidatus Peribacteria bacterium]